MIPQLLNNTGCKGFKAVFLDFSNAFNTLPCQGLLDKFAAPNPPYWLVKWVHNYFTGRSQFIRVNNKVSCTIPINCGVLQGADLSPFFFTSHTSDLFSESLNSFLKYADDVGMPRVFPLLAIPSSTFQNGLGRMA